MNILNWKLATGTGVLALVCAAILMLVAGRTAFSQGAADTDGDGIPDSVETGGIDYMLADGSRQHLDLKALGASPNHKDILVWVDWMGQSNLPVPHNHRPLGPAIQVVKDSFANSIAPQLNPDGKKGINLIVVISPGAVPHQDLVGSGDEPSIWAALDVIKTAHFPKELAPYFHYCLFAHDINLQPSGTSGISRGIPAGDFIVSLGSWGSSVGTEDEQAGTFMHELGHNLGLRHGGGDDTNYKPNFLSVMSYFFQTDGLLSPPGTARFDYSRTALRTLDESNLMETQPITSDPQFQGWNTLFFCPGQTQAGDPVSITAPVDWNCNQMIDPQPVSAPIDGSTPLTVLVGHDDWGNISLPAGLNGLGVTGKSPPAGPSSGELSLAAANGILLPPVRGLSAVSANGAIELTWTPLNQSRVVGYEVTKTDSSGAQTVVTTLAPHYVDSSKPAGDKGNKYDVQGLYVPHGFAGSIKSTKTAAGGNGLSIKGNTVSVAAPGFLSASLMGSLRQQSRTIFRQMSTGATAGFGAADLNSAAQIGTAPVILQTKAASIVVR
jgi:hypothetical protein